VPTRAADWHAYLDNVGMGKFRYSLPALDIPYNDCISGGGRQYLRVFAWPLPVLNVQRKTPRHEIGEAGICRWPGAVHAGRCPKRLLEERRGQRGGGCSSKANPSSYGIPAHCFDPLRVAAERALRLGQIGLQAISRNAPDFDLH
jgi:hypothetical protein